MLMGGDGGGVWWMGSEYSRCPLLGRMGGDLCFGVGEQKSVRR